MLAQLLTNQNTNDTSRNHNDEEHNDDDAKVIKGIQAQIASLAQREELKKVGMTRPYPLEWDSILYP